tara:strand:+ start:1093 stop:1473 length:381 start_codon:yes stop_codon:yes gene_type:complete
MAAINEDTRLVMTILFVGSMCGMNVYFYANYGGELPWNPLSHAVLFSLISIGLIMAQKALFDLVMNDRMELWLLDRKIKMYWEKKAREEQQRNKITESLRQYPNLSQKQFTNYDEISPEFLAKIEP